MDLTSFPGNITDNTTSESWIHTLSSDNAEFDDYVEHKVSEWLLLIYRPICSTFGMAGNILSIVVFLTTSLRHSPTAIYMVTLAALDCVISFYAGLQLFLLVFLGEERFFAESWHCRAYYFTFLFVIHFNTLTLVFMTAQRYVAVNFPLQAARWCTRRGAVFTLVVAGAVSLLANFVHLVTFRLNPDWDGSYRGRCSIGDGLGAYIQMRVFPWVDSVLYFFLPTVSIGALNVLIFISLRKAERFKRQAGISGFEHQQENGLAPQQEQASTTTTITPLPAIKVDAQNIPDGADADLGPVCSQRVRVVPHETMEANGAGQQGVSETVKTAVTTSLPTDRMERQVRTRSNSSAQLTRMLLTVSVTFLVLTLPAGIFVVLFRYWNPPAGHPKAQFSLVRAVAGNLMYTNHAINFLLYCLSGARFRAKAASIICYFCRARGVPWRRGED